MNYFIISADKIVDGKGSHSETQKLLSLADRKKLSFKTLEIVNLAKRWEDKLSANEFKSGASAMSAINKGRKLLSQKRADLVLIRGEDLLKTGYPGNSREQFMKLYRKKFTPLDGYTKLVPEFLRYHGLSDADFMKVREALFENYYRTFQKINPLAKRPDDRWFQPLTKYFRGVDSANPNIDYSGQILIASEKVADILKVPKKKRVRILGNAFTKLSVDGFESIPKVATYAHLKKTIKKAQAEAKIDFNTEYVKGRALLDAYTCYPVVPMGLLIEMGLVSSATDILEFLKSHEVTITGGLNLAKAPWNLTSLNSIIEMRERIMTSKKIKYGLVHGNGSLGNQQGITILGKDT